MSVAMTPKSLAERKPAEDAAQAETAHGQPEASFIEGERAEAGEGAAADDQGDDAARPGDDPFGGFAQVVAGRVKLLDRIVGSLARLRGLRPVARGSGPAHRGPILRQTGVWS